MSIARLLVLRRSVESNPDTATFDGVPGFALTEAVAAGLKQDRILTPTPVQLAAIPPILEGKHVVIESGTGTGKTLAYVLPVLQRLLQMPDARAVCIAPATELAIQVLRVAERYKAPSISSLALVTQGNQRLQASRLQKSTRLIVGTPSRILEMYEARKLKGVNIVVLDEPEPILASRDAAYLREVLSRPEPKLQLVFVGATFGTKSEQWISTLMGENVVRTRVEDDPLKSQIAHHYVRVRHEGEKDFVLSRFVTKHRCERAIVFVNQPNLIRHLYRYLTEQELPTASVSQDRTKQQCKQALLDFQQSRARILLTTDQVATGLDIPDVEWVLHYELPSSGKAYVHRAGRTGRAGKAGKSVAFITDADRVAMKRVERDLGIEFLPVP
jgi:superfamily II DNA/RNA helicase